MNLRENGRSVQTLINRLTTLTGFLALLVIAAIVAGTLLRNHDLAQVQKQDVAVRQTLCQEVERLKLYRRQDLKQSIASSTKFLRENPRGIPGIPPALIREGIARNQAALVKLAPKNCAVLG